MAALFPLRRRMAVNGNVNPRIDNMKNSLAHHSQGDSGHSQATLTEEDIIHLALVLGDDVGKFVNWAGAHFADRTRGLGMEPSVPNAKRKN
jgi:hypothetical protein